MGALGDWIVELRVRRRALPPRPGCAPARADHRRGADHARRVRAPAGRPHPRAACDRGAVGGDRGGVLQTAPYAGVARAVNAIKVLRSHTGGGRAVKAVRFEGPDGAARLGALDGEVVHDAGPAPGAGFVPSAEGWARVATAERAGAAARRAAPAAPGEPRQDRGHRPQLPRARRGVRARRARGAGRLRQVPLVADRPRVRRSSIPREETRPDWEGEVAVVIGRRTYRAERSERARGDRRDLGAQRRQRAAAPSSRRRCASSRSARASTPSRRWGRRSPRSRISTSTTSTCARRSPAS